MKKNNLVLFLTIIFLIFGSGFFYWQNTKQKQILYSTNPGSETVLDNQLNKDGNNKVNENKKEKLYIIHIDGEVKKPGVYKLKGDPRIVDALEIAGGQTVLADLRNINLAAPIYDGEKIYIPSKQNQQTSKNYSVQEETKKVNINTANKSQLEGLSGIGPSKADSIIKYRKKIGHFSDMKQLLEVSGIGEKTLARLEDELTLR